MHVVQVPRRFARDDWGGTETVILETSKCLLRHGHETEIVCPAALATEPEETIDGVRVIREPYFYPYLGLGRDARHQLDKKGGNLFSFSLMRELGRLPDLDLIHLHTGKRLGGIGRHVARRRGIPYVIELHGGAFDVPDEEARSWTSPTDGAFEWGKLLGWWVGSRRVFDDAAAVVCVGQGEREEVQRRYPEKNVVFLPNGVDPERFARGDGNGFRARHGIPAGARVLLTVGRIDPQKNQLGLVRMLPRLVTSHPDTHLLLIGHVTSDGYRKKLETQVADLGLRERVTLIPGLDASGSELVDAYHAADLFVLPSVHEPFGIVILEAWAAGLPVAASRVGGIPSFVEHERDGRLFEPSNEAEVLEQLGALIDGADGRAALAEAGRRKARETYSWDSIASRLLQVYEEALRENPVRS